MPNAKNEARIKFVAETEEFTSAIKSANSEIKTLGSELKLADATFKNTGNATEYLKSKASILKQELQANAEKQRALTEKLEVAKRIYGEGSEEVARLQRELIGAQTQEQKLATELKNTNDELEDQAKKADPAAQAIEKANAEIETLDSQLKLAEATFKNTGNATEYLKSKASILKQELQANTEKQKALTEELEAAKRTYGEDSEEVERLQRELTEAQTQEQRLAAELKNTNKELEDQAKKADPAAQAIEKIGKAGEQLQKTGKAVSDVGKKLMPVSLAVGGVGAAAIKTTADFDKSMSKVKAISGATGEDFNKLRGKAREMGRDTKFSASEAADAMGYMAMAGWKTEDMMDGISGVMNLAAASEEELGKTSDIVTDALTAFGLEAKDAGHFSDVLAATASNANTNVSMMGESFKYCAPTAGALGYSVEDVSLAIGLMGNAGIKASQAGTTLNNIFARMAKEPKEAAEIMDRLGVSLYDDEGKMYSFKEVMEQLRESFSDINMPVEEFNQKVAELDKGLEDGSISQEKYDKELEELVKQAYGAEGAEKARAAAMLAGQRGMSGLLAVVNASEEDWNSLDSAIGSASDTFVKTSDGSVVPLNEALKSGAEIIEEYSGQAEAMAATMQDNLGGDMDILKSKTEDLAISFGDLLMPTVRNVIDTIQGVVDKLNGMDDSQKQTIITIGMVVAALAPVLVVAGTVIKTVGDIMTAVKGIPAAITTIKTALTALHAVIAANPMMVIIIVIMAVVAALNYLYNHCETFRNFVDGAMAAIVGFVTTAWTTIQTKTKDILTKVRTTATSIVTGIRTKITQTWTAIRTTTTSVWNAVKSGVSNAINGAKNTVNTVANAVKTKITQTWNAIKSATTSVWNGIKSGVSNAINGAKDTASRTAEAIKTGISNTWENIKNKTTQTWDGIKTAVSSKVEAVKADIKSKFDAMKTGVESTINALKTKVSSTFDSIKNTMKEKIESAKDAVKKAVDKIKSHFPVNLGKIFKLKIPKIHVSGGKAPFGIGGAGTPPHFSVTWNRLGAIFRKPVVFGSPEYGLQGFGEAGAEVAAPLETLKTMIAETVRSNVPMIDYDRLATAVARANAKLESRMVLDHREVGRIVREMAK